ncbi:MAG: hypothetical protein ABSE17_03370 [Candidatus Levyibacteriota bacterium]
MDFEAIFAQWLPLLKKYWLPLALAFAGLLAIKKLSAQYLFAGDRHERLFSQSNQSGHRYYLGRRP